MRDELVTLVADKTGLTEDMARVAVETVVDYLRVKLPAAIAGQMDRVLGGAGTATNLAGLAGGLGDILGRK